MLARTLFPGAGFPGNKVQLPRRSQFAIYDDAQLSPRVLADAEDEATRIYQKPESLFYGLRGTGRKRMANLIRNAKIHLRQFILSCELSLTPENPATTFSALHSSPQKELGHTATHSMIDESNPVALLRFDQLREQGGTSWN
jgi:hypothetical protein